MLTTLALPGQAQASLALPPPPNGPAVALGAHAGQVGIVVTASDGQFVVQLYTADVDPSEAHIDRTPYRLAAALAAPEGTKSQLKLRGCGTGCFAAAATWLDGPNQLSLRVRAGQWHGGDVAVTVPWPAHPDPELLLKVAAALRHAGPITLYEQVTSDLSRGLGEKTTP